MVVDDNSPDGTGKVVRKLQDTLGGDNLRLITGDKAGLGKAYLRGFKDARRNSKTEAIIMMDADFSHDPESIPVLLAAIDKGADYVIGSRYVSGGSIPGDWPLRRVVNSRVANFVARKFSGIDDGILDMTGGFKAIKTSALNKINLDGISAAGYVFQVGLLHAFVGLRANIVEVPISFIDRKQGTSKMKVQDILEFIYRVYKLNPQSQIATFIRFGIVGACGTVVNLLTLAMLVHFTDFSIIAAYLIALELSILSNFYMNHLYTFKLAEGDSDSDKNSSFITKLVKFNIGALGGALIAFTTFYGLHTMLHMHYLLADLYAILLAMGWNYWMSTKIVWKVSDVRT